MRITIDQLKDALRKHPCPLCDSDMKLTRIAFDNEGKIPMSAVLETGGLPLALLALDESLSLERDVSLAYQGRRRSPLRAKYASRWYRNTTVRYVRLRLATVRFSGKLGYLGNYSAVLTQTMRLI